MTIFSHLSATPVKYRRRLINPLDYTRRLWLQVTVGFGLLFLYAPLVALVAFSFNDSKRNIVWQGFTFKYYAKAFNNSGLHDAFMNSMIIASISTVVSTVLGTLLAIGLARYKFKGKALYDGWVHLPVVIPEICLGVAMLVFFVWANIPLGLTTITTSHIAFSIPFVAVIVRSRMAGFDSSYEEAAIDLGATPWKIFWDITFPYLTPGIVAAALLAFTLSIDDFVITFFTSGPGSTTFPIKIYSMVRFSVTPEVNAASTILIALTVILTVAAMLVQGRGEKGMKK